MCESINCEGGDIRATADYGAGGLKVPAVYGEDRRNANVSFDGRKTVLGCKL